MGYTKEEAHFAGKTRWQLIHLNLAKQGLGIYGPDGLIVNNNTFGRLNKSVLESVENALRKPGHEQTDHPDLTMLEAARLFGDKFQTIIMIKDAHQKTAG